MREEDNQPVEGVISIEWTVGANAHDAGTYAWTIKCEPPLSDEIVGALLREIDKGL